MTRQNRAVATLLILGTVFLYIGVARGGYHDVFQKTVRVRLECIGIG